MGTGERNKACPCAKPLLQEHRAQECGVKLTHGTWEGKHS